MTNIDLTAEDWARLEQAATSGPPLGANAQDVRIDEALKAAIPPPAVTDIAIALSVDKTAGVVTAYPPLAKAVEWAYMPKEDGVGTLYSGAKSLTAPFMPPAGYPVLDAVALDAEGKKLGRWGVETTGKRLTTIPAEEPKPPPSSMWVGLDLGGWGGTHVAHAAKAAKYLRTQTKTEERIGQMTAVGATIVPLFNRTGAVSNMDVGAITTEVLTFFKKYGKGGTHWAGKTDLGATVAEIINEPNNPFMGRTDAGTDANAAAYTKIVREVTKATASLPNPPDILVSYDGGYSGDDYGRKLKAHGAFVDPRECPEVHPYGGTSDRAKSAEGSRKRVTEAYFDTKHAVYVTEVGWPTAVGQPATGDSLQWTEAQQRENIVNFLNWARGLGYVKGVAYFAYADYGTNNFYGVTDKYGVREKPSFTALH